MTQEQTETIVIRKEQLQRYMKDKNVESQAIAMEQMREIMYKFLAEQAKTKVEVVKDNIIVKFEI